MTSWGDNDSHDLMIAGHGAINGDESPLTYNMLYSGGGNTLSSWFACTETDELISLPTEIPTADKYLTHVTWNQGAGNVASGSIAVLRKCLSDGTWDAAGTYYKPVGQSALAAGDLTAAHHDSVLATPIGPIQDLDVLAVWLRNDTAGGTLSIGAGVAGVGTSGKRLAAIQAAAYTTDPFTIASMTATSMGARMLVSGYITTSCKRIAVTVPDYAGTAFRVPSFRNTPYHIIIPHLMAEAGQKMDIAFKAIQTAAGANKSLLVDAQTLTQDMGADDLITFDGNDVQLDDATEAGDIFTHFITHDQANKLVDLQFSNIETGKAGGTSHTDTTYVNHATKNNAAADGSRDQQYANHTSEDEIVHYTQMAFTSDGGSPTLGVGDDGKIVVARIPWIGGVSSWFANSSKAETAGQTRAHVATQLQDSSLSLFTNQPWVETFGLGNLFTDTSAANGFYKRYGLASDSTVGLHDLCELRNATIVIEAGGIINDGGGDSGLTAGERTTIIARGIKCLADIIYNAQAHDCEVVIFDWPPRLSTAGATLTNHWQYRKYFNAALMGLCQASGAIYVQTSAAITDPATKDSAAEALNTAVLGGDYAHLGTAAGEGDELVARIASSTYDGLVMSEVKWPPGVARNV